MRYLGPEFNRAGKIATGFFAIGSVGEDLDATLRKATADLPAVVPVAILLTMFIVSEEAAAAIRAAFDQGGELSAAVELRRLFPGITDNAKARECARTIAGWQPSPAKSPRSGRLPPFRRSIHR
jgi:hypothetical protein